MQAAAGHKSMSKSVFFDNDGVGLANFHAGFTAEAFVFVRGNGLAVVQFVHFHGAHVDAFAAADALVGIHSSIVTPFVLQ